MQRTHSVVWKVLRQQRNKNNNNKRKKKYDERVNAESEKEMATTQFSVQVRDQLDMQHNRFEAQCEQQMNKKK